MPFASIIWANIQKSKLKIINIKQKHAIRIVFNEDRLCHSGPLLKTLYAQTKNDNISKMFKELIKKSKRKYYNKVFKKQL